MNCPYCDKEMKSTNELIANLHYVCLGHEVPIKFVYTLYYSKNEWELFSASFNQVIDERDYLCKIAFKDLLEVSINGSAKIKKNEMMISSSSMIIAYDYGQYHHFTTINVPENFKPEVFPKLIKQLVNLKAFL